MNQVFRLGAVRNNLEEVSRESKVSWICHQGRQLLEVGEDVMDLCDSALSHLTHSRVSLTWEHDTTRSIKSRA